MAMGSLTRAISPVVCSALYAYSIARDYPFPFDYHLVFFFLALVRLVVAWMGWNRIKDIVADIVADDNQSAFLLRQ